MLVRQLQPQPNGSPLVNCRYTATTAWVEYEGIQASLFAPLYAILPVWHAGIPAAERRRHEPRPAFRP
jgi:miniconductance mechanosensitive channel